METQTPDRESSTDKAKPLYWAVAGLTALSIILNVLDKPNWLAIAGRTPLVIAFIMLATAKPPVTRAWKMTLYALIGVSIALFVTKLVSGA